MANLEGAFSPADDGHVTWFDEEGSVLASFSREGYELSAQTMSRELWEEVVDVVNQVAPHARLLRSDALPSSAVANGDVVPLSQPQKVTPEMEQVLAEYILVMERKWVVEPVPALGGLTPTEALSDPKGRRLLLDLLEDFDSVPETPGTMSTARLRALLGLT
jgi:hypothetical protein